MAGGGEHGDLHGAEPRAPGQQHVTLPCVPAAEPDRVPRFDGRADRHLGDAAVGVLDGHHRVGLARQLGTGRDAQAAAGGDRVGPGVTGRDLAADPQGDGAVLGRARDVGGDHGVPVHG